MKLDGIHHVTCITGDAPRNVDFYTGVLGPAARQEDRQPGRPDRLPPLLRGREGDAGRRHHLLRVPGRRAAAARAPAWCTRSSGASASDEALDFWAGRLGVERDGRRRPLRRPRGARARARRRARPRRAADRRPSGDPARASRCRASRACARTRATPRCAPAPFLDALGFERKDGTTTWETRGDAARRLDRVRATRPPSPASPAPARCTTSPGRRRWTSTRRGSVASPRRAAGRRRSSTASGSARSTSASRAACSSRSRRSGPASRPTRIRRTSARR